MLTFCIFNPSRPDLGRREKINLNFYFHFSLWCLKRFYEGLKGLHKTFKASQRSVKIFKLVFTLIQLSEMHGAERVKNDLHLFRHLFISIRKIFSSFNFKF